MSNVIYFYATDASKNIVEIDLDNDYMLGDSPGYIIPLLWAAFFTTEDLQEKTSVDEFDDEIECASLITTREKGIKLLGNKLLMLKKVLPKNCHSYVDEWYDYFSNQIDKPCLVLAINELLVNDYEEELPRFLDFSEQNLKELIKNYSQYDLDGFDVLVGGNYIDVFDWPFEDKLTLKIKQ